MWLRRGNGKSYSNILYSGQSAVGYCSWFVWRSVGFSMNCKGGFIELEGRLCGEKKEKDLEIHSVVHFWTVWKERNKLTFRGGGGGGGG